MHFLRKDFGPKKVLPACTSTLLALSLLAGNYSPGSAAPPDEVRVLQSDETGVTLEASFGPLEIDSMTIAGRTYDLLTIPGLSRSGEVGRPQVPLKGLMVGIPPGSRPYLDVLATQGDQLPASFSLAPVPRPLVDYRDGRPQTVGQEWLPDGETYGLDALYPRVPAVIAETGFLRDQPLALVQFYPVQYNPARGQVFFWSTIRVKIVFGAPVRAASTARPESLVFQDYLRQSMVNYEKAKGWRAQPSRALGALTSGVQTLQPSYKVSIEQEGIYQLTYGQLQGAGFPVATVDPRNIRLSNMGQEVAIEVVGEEDGRFDPHDYVLFYGQALDTKFTGTNVYWLTAGSSPGRRIARRSGAALGEAATTFTSTLHLEENHQYISFLPMEEGADHWYWERVMATQGPASAVYTATLSNLASGTYTATLRASLQSYFGSDAISQDHHARLYLNDRLLLDARWDGTASRLSVVGFPQAYLTNGSNLVKVELPNDTGMGYDAVYVNWFELEWRRDLVAVDGSLRFRGEEGNTRRYQVGGFAPGSAEVFDVTDPANVARITGGAVAQASSTYTISFGDASPTPREYLVLSPSRLKSPSSITAVSSPGLRSSADGADMIFITPSDFYTSVLPLANYRAQQGLRVKVARMEDVYDEFNYGIFDPKAIKDFLAYAYARWQPPAPSYVLLVGDGNLDFRNYLGTNEKNYVPPYLALVDPWMGETATDNAYVTVSGDDIMPDMFIGRLPVSSPTQASAVASKILSYEQTPLTGDWRKRVVLVADNGDSAGDFPTLSNALADGYLPAPYTSQKIYLGVNYSSAGEVKSALVQAISRGALLVQFVGHSSVQAWAKEEVFGIDDIPSLAKGSLLPLMLPLTCFDGYFVYPAFPSLAESLVAAEGKGAIASFSATGQGIATGHDYLARGLFKALFAQRTAALGPATTQAKLELYSGTTGYRDLISTYLLFGDPAMKLALAPIGVYLPALMKSAGNGW